MLYVPENIGRQWEDTKQVGLLTFWSITRYFFDRRRRTERVFVIYNYCTLNTDFTVVMGVASSQNRILESSGATPRQVTVQEERQPWQEE